MSEKIERVLQEWPLSKVELISDGDEKFVRKSVHPYLGREAVRQQAIYAVAEGFTTPKVLKISDSDERTVIDMEYVESIRPATFNDATELIRKFHDVTQPLIKSELFTPYSLENLENDLETARQYGKVPEELNPDFFRPIFNNQAVLHGDWALDQILIGADEPAIIDFGRSFVGPRILDEVHMLRFETDIFNIIDDRNLLKASIVADVQRMAWFELCKRNFIDYHYSNEMAAGIMGINTAFDKLNER